jgi:hypothetical protein
MRKPVEARAGMDYTDVVSPVVTSCAFFLGRPFGKDRRLPDDPDPEEAASCDQRLVTAIRHLGVETEFRRCCVEPARRSRTLDGPGAASPGSGPGTRIKAIRDLEALSRERPESHPSLMEALCAFVRQNAVIEDEAKPLEPRCDVQTALEAIGRLGQGAGRRGRAAPQSGRANLALTMLTLVRLPKAWLAAADLTGSRLDHADLSGAVLAGASLIAARLKGADLSCADLSGADLTGACLESADLEAARLDGANLGHTDLRRARLHDARLVQADLDGWCCERASLRGADLTGVRNLDGWTLRTCYGVRSGIGRTILPVGVSAPQHWCAAILRSSGSGDRPDQALKAYEARYRDWLASAPSRA